MTVSIGDLQVSDEPNDFLSSTMVVFLWMIFLYGFYALLFIICVYVLFKRRKPKWKFHLVTSTILFVLATVQSISSVVFVFYIMNKFPQTILSDTDCPFCVSFPLGLQRMITGMEGIYIISNFVADMILIYRFCIVWGMNRKILVGTGIISVVNNVAAMVAWILDIVAATNSHMPFSGPFNLYEKNIFRLINFVFNLIVTGLIAGRIWYLRHRAAKILNAKIMLKYKSAIIILLESGLIYSVVIAIGTFPFSSFSSYDLYPALLSQTAGIAPTMIIVRSGLGITTDSVDSTLASMQIKSKQKPHAHDTAQLSQDPDFQRDSETVVV